MKPSGHTSVMASRAESAPDALDYFPTPPWAARAGGELIRSLDPTPGACWEPACGEGHMAYGLKDYFDEVQASDIFPYGYGGVVDFLDAPPRRADWVVTNPPFKLGTEFVRTAWPRARRGVAMLLRLAFLEGGARHTMFTCDCPLSLVAPFAERVPMVKGRWDPEASSATAYAWFIWIKQPVINEAGERGLAASKLWPMLRWIPPGTKERLSRPDDARVFGESGAGPLFAGAAA